MEQNEQFNTPEKTEAEWYDEYKAAFEEERTALAELTAFLSAAKNAGKEPEPSEARNLIERMDTASKRGRIALDGWLAAMEKDRDHQNRTEGDSSLS